MNNTSSQHHSFDVLLAKRFGIEEAILIHHFQFWIRINRFKKKNIIDGKCWTYQSRKDIQAHFPYWSVEEVRRICEKLETMGVLVTANFNKSSIDRTLWYAFADEEMFGVDEKFSNSFYERQNCQMQMADSPNANGKSATAIPDTKTDTTKEEHPPTPQGESVGYGKFVRLTKEEFEELRELIGSTNTLSDLINEVNDYLASTGKKPYKDYAATIRNWWRRRQKEPQNAKKGVFERNKELAQKIVATLKHREIELYPESIGFINHGGHSIFISFNDLAFREQVLNRLRKMNLPINGF